jgi:hypothetical protein
MKETSTTPVPSQAFVIRDLTTSEEIDRIDVSGKGERQIEKIERGLAMRLDFARFYFGLEDGTSE